MNKQVSIFVRRATLSAMTCGLAWQIGGWAAIAQETIQKAPVSEVRIPELKQPSESLAAVAAPTVNEWQEITKDASGSDVSKILEMAGWNAEAEGSEVKKLSADGKFSLYTRNIAAGVSDFLVVPESNGQLHPIEFKSAASGVLHTAGWGVPSAEDLRDEIVAGMQAAIDSLCGMKARPTEITVKASAAGIVEVEAKWLSVEVCAAP